MASIKSESERSAYINKLHNKTKIGKRAIAKDIKKITTKENPSEKNIFNANFPGLIDIVLGKNRESLYLFYVCLTYLQDHRDVHYLPELMFCAVPERGKSRTGKAMTYTAYRGIHLVELREANLFRYSRDMNATLFFDIMDLWKKAEANKVEDILLLRYEKGAKVSRVLYPEKGAFNDMEYYDIFGPIISTNEAVHKILDTRCIPIIMPNKPGNYENPRIENGLELKERLTAFRARVMDMSLPEIDTIKGLSGRFWDISKPLLQVCEIIYPQGLNDLKDTLIDISKQKLEDKKASIEGQIIEILHKNSPPDEDNVFEWEIATSEVLNELNENRPDKYTLSPQYLGRKLKSMGINTRKIHGYSEIQLKKPEFDTLLIQYGIINTPTPPETLPNSTKGISNKIPDTYTSRELVESKQNPTKTLPTQAIDNKEVMRMVESGREW